MSANRAAIVIGTLLLVMVIGRTAQSEILGDFLSYRACADCHADIVEGWSTTPHAKAFETLRTQGEEKLTNPNCVKCHVVGFDAEGGFIDNELTPELAGVQCECCHGPGAKHVETEEIENIVVKPDEGVCRVCHTEGQDKNFDYEKKSRLVHGAE